MKFLKKERQIAKIIKINETIKNDEPCMILIEKLNVDKLLNSLHEIDVEITKHLTTDEGSEHTK